jgi:hypothetical protein
VEEALQEAVKGGDRGRLLCAARMLGAVRDQARLEALAARFGTGQPAGQMVRMRLGIVRALSGDFATAVGPIAEAFGSAGQPDSFLDLHFKALLGAGRFGDAAHLLASGLPWTPPADWRRWGSLQDEWGEGLAVLLAAPRSGIGDPIGFLDGLGDREKDLPICPFYPALVFCLSAKGRGEDSLLAAARLLRCSGWDDAHVPCFLRRLAEDGRAEAIRRMVPDAHGKGHAAAPLAVALAMDMVREGAESPSDILKRVKEAFPGPGCEGPRREVLDALARAALDRNSPELAACALEALAGEAGRRPDLLRRLEAATMACGRIDAAASVALELIRAGRFGWEELEVLRKAVDQGRMQEEWVRVMSSRVEMELHRPAKLLE